MAQDLEIVIKAVNQSKAQIDEVTRGLDGVKSSMDKVKASSESQATSVFKGAAMYDVLRQSLDAVVGFFKESITSSLEADRIMTQVATNVKNAGFSYSELSPKIEEASKRAKQLGFDDEDSAQSLSKLLLVTKDFSQAQALNNLAMDLARNKNIDLDSATKMVTLATQGNVKELKLLGINLSENASTAENMISMQNQLADSATNYSNTTGGHLKTMEIAWDDLKKKIGNEMMPEMEKMFSLILENQSTIEALANGLIFLGKSVAYVAKGFVDFGKIFATGISSVAEKATSDLSTVTWALNKIGLASDDAVKKNDALAQSWKDTTKELVADTMGDNEPTLVKATKQSTTALKDLRDTSSKSLAAIKNAADDLLKLKDSVASAKQGYKDFNASVNETLTGLEDSHRSTMETLSNDIKKVKASMQDLSSTYQKSVADINNSFNSVRVSDDKSMAEKIVANEDKIAELQKEKAAGVTADRLAILQKELDGRMLAETQNADFIAQFATQIADVKRFNGLSELQQEIENYNQKRALAQQDLNEKLSNLAIEYNAKQNALKQELADIKQKQKDEDAIYADRKVFILSEQAKALEVNKAFAAANLKVTAAQVKSEIDYYNQLASAIKASRSGGQSSFSNIKDSVNSITVSIPKLASGGIVDRPTLAMIGEAGPEAVVPLGKGGGFGGVTVIINGGNFLSEDVATDIGDLIFKKLKLSNQL